MSLDPHPHLPSMDRVAPACPLHVKTFDQETTATETGGQRLKPLHTGAQYRAKLLRPFASYAPAIPGGASLCPGLSNPSPPGCRPGSAEEVLGHVRLYITENYAPGPTRKMWVTRRSHQGVSMDATRWC